MPSNPITPAFLPSLGLMAQSRRSAGLDQPQGDPSRPPLPRQPRPFPAPEPLLPQINQGSLQGRSNLTLGADRPMDLSTEGPQFASGFDPTAQVPGSMSYGGPRLNTAGALAGLRSTQVPSALGPYGSREELFKQASGVGNAPWSQAMAQDTLKPMLQQEQFGRDQFQKHTGDVNAALTGQHPAILGLQQFEAEQKSLPQQYEAQGRILGEREQARGIIGGAQANAAGRQRAAALSGLAPLLAQLGLAQEREQQSAVDGLDDFETRNAQAIRALQQIIAEYRQRPEFQIDAQ